MAANLTAKFKLVDEMSDRMEAIANSGNSLLETWERIGSAASEATQATDHWTTAVGNYDKGALEAIYSTEELVEMGFKTADALEDAGDAADAMASADERAKKAVDSLADASEDAGEEVKKTGEKGAAAMNELEQAITSAGIIVLLKQVADGFLEASRAAAEYEVAVMKISTVADTTTVSMDTISNDLLELSQETGISVGELSEATYSALSASVETSKAVQFTATATQLAAGGFTSSATAVDVLTTALNAYGLSADKAEYISDLLITTQNLGKTTVDQLASSVGKVIPLASAYGVEMDNLSAAYAELTKGGIATAESGTYLKAMLNELGDSASTVSEVLKAQTGDSFSQLMEKGYSLGDVMEVLGNSVNGNAGAFNELWSSSEAGIGALSLYNAGAEQFNTTLEAMQTSAGATATAYATMTNTTAHAEEELSNATDNLKIAIGDSLNPAMEKLYSTSAKVVNGLATFAKENPKVVKAVAALTLGVGVFVAGIVAYTVATKAAAIAQAALNAVMDANPMYLLATAVVAATVALVGFISAAGESKDYSEELCYSSRKQAEELENLKEQYEEACDTYGETSEQAYDLQYQIEYLTGQFESGKKTIGEYIDEIEELNRTWNENLDASRETYDQVEENEGKTLALVRQLERLANQQDITTESEAQMKAIIEQLNDELPTLNLNYEDVIANAGSFAESVEALVKAQAASKRYEAAMEGAIEAQQTLMDSSAELAEQKETESALIEEVAEKEEAYNKAREAHLDWVTQGGRGQYGSTLAAQEREAKDAYETSRQELELLQQEIEETEGTVNRAQSEYDDYIGKITELTEANANAYASAESVNDVIDAMADSVTELAAAYNEAYEAAKTSFDGQFGLFDEAQANMEATVQNAQAALDSQLAYWDNYLANVNVLKETSAADLGITQENYNALMTYVQDGSAEAAGLAQSMVNAINSGNTEAVTKLGETVGAVQAKRDEAAGAVAEWQIDFNGKMDEIVQKAEQAVKDMNLSSEAAAAASSTINAYANAILAQGGKAIANAKSIASQVRAALNSGNVSGPSIKGYAEGTDYATPGPHLVGENGPEIVEFRGGEKVYTNDETERIMARSAAVKYFAAPEGGTAVQDSAQANPDENTKTIRLEINGGGAIEVSRSMDESTVVEILQANLKPVLTSIVKQEIYEEGEQSYDF